MSRFADREKQSLLELARRALTAGVKEHKLNEEIPNDKTLMSPGGAFVTLHRRGRLRGCVGQLPSGESLAAVVAHCAQAAALEDPRFE
ncbi:MAG: AMMECR1 domain-containing protein, partial [Candidatus Acidiferrales bacterium]